MADRLEQCASSRLRVSLRGFAVVLVCSCMCAGTSWNARRASQLLVAFFFVVSFFHHVLFLLSVTFHFKRMNHQLAQHQVLYSVLVYSSRKRAGVDYFKERKYEVLSEALIYFESEVRPPGHDTAPFIFLSAPPCHWGREQTRHSRSRLWNGKPTRNKCSEMSSASNLHYMNAEKHSARRISPPN